MAALVQVSSHPQNPKLRPPPGSQNVTSSSIAVGSGCSHPKMMKSKVPRLIVESLQRLNRQPDIAQKNKLDGVRCRKKNNSKLRKFFSLVFIGDGRRGSTSGDDEKRGNSSFSSTSSTVKKEDNKAKKTKQYFHVGTKSTIAAALNNGGRILSRGNSFRGFSSRIRGESTSKKAAKEEEEEIRNELCKKKIVMGGKCKPLNCDGKLHYDEEGILVAEPLPP